MMADKSNPLKEKSFAFALRCINLYKYCSEAKKEYVISKQLLRSRTSVGANIREAQNAESKSDFTHKLGVAQKECDESRYWLELLKAAGFIHENEFQSIYDESNELLKMLRSAIITSKKSMK